MYHSSFAHLNNFDYAPHAPAPVKAGSKERSAAEGRRGSHRRGHQLHRLLRRKPVLAR